jgi:hypothetical protein
LGATGAEQSAAQPDGAPARQPLSASYLVDRYLERGWSSDRIAADTGWSGQYVRDRLREHQIPLRRRNESPPGRRADHAQVLTWLEQGVPVAEVAHRSGYTPSGIYALLQRNGRPAPGPQPRPRPIEAADVGALYRQGLSWPRSVTDTAAAPTGLAHASSRPEPRCAGAADVLSSTRPRCTTD